MVERAAEEKVMDGEVLLFFGERPGALPLYEALERAVLQAEPGAARRVQKTQITFANKRVFACASFLRPVRGLSGVFLTVSFGLGRPVDSQRVAGRVEPYPGRWTHHVVVRREGEIDRELLGWIQEAAAFSAGKR